MESYIMFLSFMGSSGGMVLSFFGGLKPIAASLMNDYNVFCYMDSAFINSLEPLVERVRQLRLADFTEEGDEDDNQVREGHIHEDHPASPPMVLVSSKDLRD